MTTTIDVNDAKQQWSRLLDLAKSGNEVIIAEGDKPVARLTAIRPFSASKQRIAGLHPALFGPVKILTNLFPTRSGLMVNENPARNPHLHLVG